MKETCELLHDRVLPHLKAEHIAQKPSADSIRTIKGRSFSTKQKTKALGFVPSVDHVCLILKQLWDAEFDVLSVFSPSELINMLAFLHEVRNKDLCGGILVAHVTPSDQMDPSSRSGRDIGQRTYEEVRLLGHLALGAPHDLVELLPHSSFDFHVSMLQMVQRSFMETAYWTLGTSAFG